MNYIVQPIFPEGGVHLIGGVLGVAPQRLILPWLSQSHADGTFLGHPSRAFRHFYVALEETEVSLKNKLATGGFSGTVRAAAIDQVRPLTVEGMVKLIPPDTEVLVIGNIGALIENKLASPQRVLVLIPELRAFAEERNLTVIGITGASKSYSGRERIKGSYVWLHFTDTVVILDPGSQPDTVTAKIFPVNSKPEVVEVPLPPPLAEVRPA